MKVRRACLSTALAFAATTQAFPASRHLLQASFTWPLYSQQCADDAGPPFADDAATFGASGKYHDNSKAVAVLQDGACAGPVKDACEKRAAGGAVTPEIARAAYLEGPLQCGGRGWFCRILPDGNHDGGIRRDWNFNHCNETDYGDTAGHCHGSDNDDVYYWWVRDHWHRNYAGRLHCCCDWGATLGVVARCDYRAPLQPGEWENCRDANEDHTGPGSGFSLGFEKGCPNLGTTDPLPEPAEGQCWDVLNFAPGGEDSDDNNGGGGDVTPPEDDDTDVNTPEDDGTDGPADGPEDGDGERPENDGERPENDGEDSGEDEPVDEEKPEEDDGEMPEEEDHSTHEEEEEEEQEDHSTHEEEEEEEDHSTHEEEEEEEEEDHSTQQEEEEEENSGDEEEEQDTGDGEEEEEEEESPQNRFRHRRRKRGRGRV